MVDRSQPLVVTPQACPFVALDGDRDSRRDAPDALHRCFAEETPRARSMGHQAAFCLAPAFTGCPIFLDWASRVAADVIEAPVGVAVGGGIAAAAIDGPAGPSATAGTTGKAGGVGALAPAASAATGTETVSRPWAAAPPWLAEAVPPGDPLDMPRRTAVVDIDTGVEAPAVPTETREPASQPTPIDDDGAAAELAASMARTDLAAGADENGAAAQPDGSPDTPPWSRGRPRVPVDAGAPSSLAPQTRPGARPAAPREWEGARRFEAYAARTGAGRPGRPVLVAIGAVVVAVSLLVVFLLPSLFAGAGVQASPTPDPAASGASASQRPDATPREPDVTPERPDPTPRSYRVKSGDTLSRISRRFNVTVEQLQCVNDIRNPNSVRVGTTLIIPVESYECPRATRKPAKTPQS